MRSGETIGNYESDEGDEKLEALHERYLVYMKEGVGDESGLSDEDEESVLIDLVCNSARVEEYWRKLSDFRQSPEGDAFIEESVVKALREQKDKTTTREDVWAYLVGRNIDKRWFDVLVRERPDIYAEDFEVMRKRMTPVCIDLIKSPEGGGLDRELFDALPDDSIDFANLNEAEITPVITHFVEVVARKMGLEECPSCEVTISKDERTIDVCSNEGKAYNDRTIKVDVNSHLSLAAIAETVVHELWHQRQKEIELREEGAMARKYKINHDFYIGSKNKEVGYDAYRAQLLEREAWYIGEQFGLMFRDDYFDRNPEKIDEMAKVYDEIYEGRYNPTDVMDGFDLKYYVVAKRLQLKRQKNNG